MNKKKKIAIIVGVVVLVLAVVGLTVTQSRKNVALVQTGKVVKQDLASMVTASGEIKPKTFVNIGANGYGKIVKLHVLEGETVKQGQLLAQLENVQSSADVAANRSNFTAAQTDAEAAAAGYKTAAAELRRAQAEGERTRLDFERAEELFKAKLIAKAEFDSRKAAFDAAAAALAQAEARMAQTKAQATSASERIRQAQATLTRASDVLNKTIYSAPFDGIITNLPVREGETVVMGIQNSPGSTLMTLADMSVITAEVKVDETDIVNVKVGQKAKVTIDALPKQEFSGTVTEIGNNAVLRSTGLATSQTTAGSQEAKDFKVVVTLDTPPKNLRPGLSATAKITTATRDDVLSIPIQALTIRQRGELEKDKEKGKGGKDTVQAAAPAGKDASKEKEKSKEELQGVFVVRNKKAEFVPVETGITGVTEIEVTSGLKDGDEIITGSYKVLRSLKTGANVKVDNSAPQKAGEES